MVVELTWSIENISMCARKLLDSPIFNVDLLGRTKWCMQLHFAELPNKNISCTVYRIKNEGDIGTVTIRISMAIVASFGARDRVQKFDSWTLDESHSAILFSSLIGLEQLEREREVLLPKDVLTLRCNIWSVRHSNLNLRGESLWKSEGLPNPVFSEEKSSANFRKSNTYKVCQPQKIFARTHIEVFRRDVLLSIRELNGECPEQQATLFFPSALDEDCTLVMHLHIKLHAKESKKLDIKLWRNVEDYTKCMLVQCKLSILADFSGSTSRFPPLIERFRFRDKMCVWSLNKESSIFSQIGDLIKHANLTLKFEFAVSHEGCEYPSTLPGPSAAAAIESSKILGDELLQLYLEKKHCDVVLRTRNGCVLNAHKSILSSQSPIFQDIFQNNITESVDVFNVEPGTLDNMLKFIYSGVLKEMNTIDICKLYAAAKDYAISPLEKECSYLLKSSLIYSVNNVCNALLLAYELSDAEFLGYITDFLVIHGDQILKSSEWDQFRKNNKVLTDEIESNVKKIRENNEEPALTVLFRKVL